jgi:hypothetical protein
MEQLVVVESNSDVVETVDELVEVKRQLDKLRHRERILKDRIKVFYGTGDGPAFVGTRGVVTVTKSKPAVTLDARLIRNTLSAEQVRSFEKIGEPRTSIRITYNKTQEEES